MIKIENKILEFLDINLSEDEVIEKFERFRSEYFLLSKKGIEKVAKDNNLQLKAESKVYDGIFYGERRVFTLLTGPRIRIEYKDQLNDELGKLNTALIELDCGKSIVFLNIMSYMDSYDMTVMKSGNIRYGKYLGRFHSDNSYANVRITAPNFINPNYTIRRECYLNDVMVEKDKIIKLIEIKKSKNLFNLKKELK